jgi:hypothetical protein
MPSHGAAARPVDLFEHDPPQVWLVTDERREPRRDVVGIFNWDRNERTIEYPLKQLGLDDGLAYAAFDYWANETAEPIERRLNVTVPGRSCRILSLRPRLDRPQVISTSRHVAQGMIDVTAEDWLERSRTLRGTSRIVRNDDYELRIVVPDASWKAKGVTVIDNEGGVISALRQEGTLVRATLHSQTDKEVGWAVQFE